MLLTTAPADVSDVCGCPPPVCPAAASAAEEKRKHAPSTAAAKPLMWQSERSGSSIASTSAGRFGVIAQKASAASLLSHSHAKRSRNIAREANIGARAWSASQRPSAQRDRSPADSPDGARSSSTLASALASRMEHSTPAHSHACCGCCCAAPSAGLPVAASDASVAAKRASIASVASGGRACGSVAPGGCSAARESWMSKRPRSELRKSSHAAVCAATFFHAQPCSGTAATRGKRARSRESARLRGSGGGAQRGEQHTRATRAISRLPPTAGLEPETARNKFKEVLSGVRPSIRLSRYRREPPGHERTF
eukprot:3351715-Pleurochrysis_carterae.AAC.1